MGLIPQAFSFLFGGERNLVAETAGVFWENAEAAGRREVDLRSAAMAQFAQEFAVKQRSWFDALIDGVNRIPRPAMALGTIGLFVAAMVDPVWFGARMQGMALVPEPLWWLLGAVVSFYFGARFQVKGQEFQRSLAETMARTPQVIGNIAALETMRADSAGAADPGTDAELALEATRPEDNPALTDWRREGR